MSTWNTLSDADKSAHNAAVNAALIEYQMLAEKVKADSAWIGKNGPAAAPFGRETVETRNAAMTASKASEAMMKYEAMLGKYRG